MELSASLSGRFNPRNRAIWSHFVRGWVSLRALKNCYFYDSEEVKIKSKLNQIEKRSEQISSLSKRIKY
jgi:hypothetical protein